MYFLTLRNINQRYKSYADESWIDSLLRNDPQSGPKKAKLQCDGCCVLAQNPLPSFLFEFPSACYATNPRTGLALPNIRGMLSLYTFPTPGMASSFQLRPRTSFAKIRGGIPPLATVPIAHLKSFLDWILRAISIIKQPRPVEPVGREKRKKERERKEGRKKTCFHPFLRGRLKLRGIMGAGAWSMSVKPFSGARIHLSVPRRCPIRNNV